MLDSLLAPVASWIAGVISAAGHAGVAGLMAVEFACIPLPSEVIMPFAGYLAPPLPMPPGHAAAGPWLSDGGAPSCSARATWTVPTYA